MSRCDDGVSTTETVGLLGGAFDPPHNGHLTLAREALRQLALRKLLVVVTGAAPHKQIETDPATRLHLAQIAFAGLADVDVSRIELDRPGLSYTLDTVRWARDRYGDTTFVIGADEFASFLEWHEPDAVLEATRLAVATRPGFPRESLEPVLAQLQRPDRVRFFPIPELPISSHDVRRLAAAGKPLGTLVPASVEREIRERRLYRNEIPGQQVPSACMQPTSEGS